MMPRRAQVRLTLALCLALPGSAAAEPLKTLDMPGGAGKVVYGPVAGASSPAEAMGAVLRSVHESCRERPQVGKVFRVRNSDSFAVFFTVVNHPQGNKQVAGLLIASASGRGGAEAALVSDDASRFSTTVNPMLTELFRVWHPGEASAAAAPPAQGPAPAAAGRSAPAPRLHTVTASDNSASIGIPEGWSLNPNSGHGAMMVQGPEGEAMALGLMKSGVDPTHPWQRNFARMGGRPLPGQFVYPYRGNLAQAFPGILQAWRRSNGQGPARLEVEKADPVSPPAGSPPGQECVVVQGHLDPDGKGMRKLSELMCAAPPADWGGYVVTRSQSLFPDSDPPRRQATLNAILGSWKVNAEVLNRQNEEALRQKAMDDAAIGAQTRRAVADIHAIGERATIRYNAAQAANDAQHAGYWAQQDSNARRSQSFGNYLLDQTVIQDNNLYPNGTVGHGTVWSSTADALVRSDPNRYEYVSSPNFWKGVDY
jgi:hypothetical protein